MALPPAPADALVAATCSRRRELLASHSLAVTAYGSIDRVETERLVLLRWRGDYVDEHARICADPDVVRFITGGEPLRREIVEELSERARSSWRQHGFGPWAALDRETGSWVGRIGLNLLEDWVGPDRWEVSFELAPRFWERGLATEGARKAIDVGFACARLERIIGVTARGHRASRRVMEKCGMSYRGALVWRGAEVVWYEIEPAARS
jgi:ribosomal-protein-alanine N-acetyltransferase